MRKLRALLSKQGFFVMVGLCIVCIGASGFWALSSKRDQQAEQQVDSSLDSIQNIENAKQYHMICPVDGGVQAVYDTLSWQDTLSRWGAHEAVDISAAKGEGVRSAQAGHVSAVYRDALWGGVAEVVHEHGLKTKYCGLLWPLPVWDGAQVTAGQIIGYLAAVPIESMVGSHVHFEASIDDVMIDPAQYM